VLLAAQEDFLHGHLWSLKERVHADLFDDYLEMSIHLLSDGYITAAAVIAGTTLEEHLRKLCQKNDIGVATIKRDGSSGAKKASVMNDELVKAEVIQKAEGRLSQAWIDIRNDCAHNLSTDYESKQIQQMIDGIREFTVRHPA
jgi:hypothetical protein